MERHALALEIKALLWANRGSGAVPPSDGSTLATAAATASTLAVAESLTCGHVQAAIGAVSGASQFFLGGVTAYSGAQKVALLNVSERDGAAVNWVSATVAEQMALGAAQLFNSDFALATTGYAEPAPEWGVERPFAWWAVARRQPKSPPGLQTIVHSARVDCAPGESRIEVQKKVTAAALAGLVTFLQRLR